MRFHGLGAAVQTMIRRLEEVTPVAVLLGVNGCVVVGVATSSHRLVDSVNPHSQSFPIAVTEPAHPFLREQLPVEADEFSGLWLTAHFGK